MNGPTISMSEVFRAALTSVSPDARDAAAARLADTYCREIDMGGDLAKLGPPLLAALEALQMTPRARAVAQRGGRGEPEPVADPINELGLRRARKSRTADLDATTS